MAEAEEIWLQACAVDDVDVEDVLRFDHGELTFAVIRDPDGNFHATDGLCSHERAHLADGLVIGDIIECPKHNGRFNYATGEAKRAPARIALRTYPVKVESGNVFIRVS